MRVTPTRVKIATSVPTSSGRPRCDASAVAGILAFGILAHDHPVEIARTDIAQRRRDARQDLGRPHIGVLVEALADRQPQPPERDVVGHVGRADRAEIDGVEFLERRRARPPAS